MPDPRDIIETWIRTAMSLAHYEPDDLLEALADAGYQVVPEASTCDARIDRLARALRALTHPFWPDRWSRNPAATTERCVCAEPSDHPVHQTPEVVLGPAGEWFGREPYTGPERALGAPEAAWDVPADTSRPDPRDVA